MPESPRPPAPPARSGARRAALLAAAAASIWAGTPATAPEGAAAPGPAAVVRAVPRPARVAPGEIVTIHVTARGLRGASAVAFQLEYDPALVAPVTEAFQEGRLLGRDGAATSFLARPATTGDRIVVGISRLGAGPGARGDGTLCRLAFRALREGTASFSFAKERVMGPDLSERRARFVAGPVRIDSRARGGASGGRGSP